MATMAEESFEFRVDQGIAFALASLQNSGLDALANVPIPQNMIEAATITTSNDVSTPTTEEASLELGKTGCSPGTDPSATVATKIDNSVVDGDDQEIDAEKKLARSRERNREHARKTRMRKKAQLEALQSKVKGLEAERQVLKQKVEECGVASILLGLSAGANDIGLLGDRKENEESEVSRAASPDVVAILSGTKRKRFISEAIGEQSEIPQQQSLTINIDGQITEIGSGKSHINWKTGVYKDQGGVQKQLTPEQLADLRRERNRMHAKMTRTRKKCFIATVQKAIDDLEAENRRMRDTLNKVSVTMVTPVTSPLISPQQSPKIHDGSDNESVYSQPAEVKLMSIKKQKVAHGFRLDD